LRERFAGPQSVRGGSAGAHLRNPDIGCSGLDGILISRSLRFLHPGAPPESHQEIPMSDLIYLTIVLSFFGISIAYVNGCERLRGGSHE